MSASRFAINPRVLLGVPTLEEHPLSWQWMDYYQGLDFGLGAAAARLRVYGQKVDDARNAIVTEAMRINAAYVLFLGDDVLAPANTFHLLHRHREMMVTGVYWTKGYPTYPYLWNGLMEGPFIDWKMGEYLPVDWAGCDCLLVHTDVFKAIEPPWFSCEYANDEGQKPIALATEDLYFYTKARKAGFRLHVDTEVQCNHQERSNGVQFGLTADMPQAQPDAPHPSADPHITVADLGSGFATKWFGANAQITRFDGDDFVRPDVRCDLRAIPRADDTFDVVNASHVLEHFAPFEAPAIVREWLRILKPGGKLRIEVPNVEWAAEQIIKARDTGTEVPEYAGWVFNGQQKGSPNEVHKTCFTPAGLKALLEMIGVDELDVHAAGDDGNVIELLARKRPVARLVVARAWREIEQAEMTGTNGHAAWVTTDIDHVPEPAAAPTDDTGHALSGPRKPGLDELIEAASAAARLGALS